MILKGLNLAKPLKVPAPRVIDKNSREAPRLIKEATHQADAEIAQVDQMIDKAKPEAKRIESNISDANEKLNRLVDDDFPFDDTQMIAIEGLLKEQYGCMIGAAGTGKTTTTKKLVDLLQDSLDLIDMSQYWSKGQPAEGDDDYETPESFIPSIVMVSFTGRATQMIKKNFPREWHGNIMTIHRALGFYPEFYQDYDDSTGQLANKRRFTPTYNEELKMPWDIIIVDEAGMLGLPLWHQLWAAIKPTTRIILIGDINQLPPTHGKSILGFALGHWPTWELTHVHRQKGANNSIVDNAHRILNGVHPKSDSPNPLSFNTQESMVKALNFMLTDPDWRFITVEVPAEHRAASLRIRQALQLLQGKLYEPNRDVLITPINGFEQTAPGYSLGQDPLNQELVVKLNSSNPRYFIDAGRERQNFALGDKVMATINDYEAGITNGMTGIVTDIAENGAYIGDSNRWGLVAEVEEYLAGLEEPEDEVEFSLEQMVADSAAGMEELKKKEARDAGPASHSVTVKFGEGEHSFEIAFDSKSKVGSLMLAYAATCHKMQGGECPLVFGIVHQANRRPLNREWFYTMVTRASQRCVVFTTRQGLGFALGKQTIRGKTLEQKVAGFRALMKVGPIGAAVNVKIPNPKSLVESKEIVQHEQHVPDSLKTPEPEPEPVEPPRPSIKTRTIHVHLHVTESAKVPDIDGGDLITQESPKQLTYQPKPEPVTPAKLTIGQLLARQRTKK